MIPCNRDDVLQHRRQARRPRATMALDDRRSNCCVLQSLLLSPLCYLRRLNCRRAFRETPGAPSSRRFRQVASPSASPVGCVAAAMMSAGLFDFMSAPTFVLTIHPSSVDGEVGRVVPPSISTGKPRMPTRPPQVRLPINGPSESLRNIHGRRSPPLPAVSSMIIAFGP